MLRARIICHIKYQQKAEVSSIVRYHAQNGTMLDTFSFVSNQEEEDLNFFNYEIQCTVLPMSHYNSSVDALKSTS